MTLVRWIARVWSGLNVAFILLLMFGQGLIVNGAELTVTEWIGLLFFPFGLVVGLLAAWRYERVGSVIAIASVFGFYLWNFIASGTWPRGPFILLLALPAFLFFGVAWSRPTAQHSKGET